MNDSSQGCGIPSNTETLSGEPQSATFLDGLDNVPESEQRSILAPKNASCKMVECAAEIDPIWADLLWAAAGKLQATKIHRLCIC